MKKIFLLLAFIGLIGCQPKNEPSDVATRASGRYSVQYYVVDGDTLLSTKGINKLGLSSYYIDISRVGPDSVSVINYSTKNGSDCGIGGFAHVVEVNGKFQLSANVGSRDVYESSIRDGLFYQRTVGMNVDSLKKHWDIDSLKVPYNVPNREVIISAKK